MNILSVDRISKAHGDKTLFRDVSFGIAEGEKLGLIGPNGSGKSTLLSLLAEQDQPDSGLLARRRGLRTAYLRQLPVFNPAHTVLDHIFAADTPHLRLLRAYEEQTRLVTQGHEPAAEELDRLTAEMQRTGGWEYEQRLRSILRELGIADLQAKMSALSGGMLKKVSIAQTLMDEAELLLLDEPTNHLDVDTIVWLESYLERTTQSVVLITHDRYFLETVTNRILELEPPDLYYYTGSYGTYLEKKAEREESRARSESKAQNFLRTELEWLRKQPRARGTKQKARIDRIKDVQNRREYTVEDGFEFAVTGRRMGKQILEMEAVGKRVPGQADGRVLFENFSYHFKAGERVGLVGPNGSGKSTFLNVVTGALPPDSGEVRRGLNTHFGYFDQTGATLDSNRRVLEFIKREAGEYLSLADNERMEAGKVLEYFRFDGRLQNAVIGRLSGGERRRLQLVYILMKNPNFLILDEPTNDLDIPTLSLLEDFLTRFGGCLLVVSHDRYFMDRVADRLFVFGKPEIEFFIGNYSDYLESRGRDTDTAKPSAPAATRPPVPVSPPPDTTSGVPADDGPRKKKKLSNKEKRELDSVEKEIAQLESERAEIEAQLAAGTGDHKQLAAWGERHAALGALIEAKYSRWNEIADLAESLE